MAFASSTGLRLGAARCSTGASASAFVSKAPGFVHVAGGGQKKRARGAGCVKMLAEEIQEQIAWVDALPANELSPGVAVSRIVASLDICIVCDETGIVFAVGNKVPPLGTPLQDGEVVTDSDGSYIRDPQYGTLFDLSTGEAKPSTWISKPPLVSNVLRTLFKEPGALPVYPTRISDGMLQICLNVNAKLQFESKYWKGILDASGKTDGGYY